MGHMSTAKTYINDSGYIEVGNGHSLYYEDWGNPDGVPIISLHGGPGSGFSDRHKLLFDPKKHHVLFHDQRGAGRSTPFASTEHNTTQDLIADIELLREQAGFKKAHIVGGSWGSTLSLLYALAYPEQVKSLLIWGVYLARQIENDWVNEGYPRYQFPAEWERFIALVPQKYRGDGTATMDYYAKKMRSKDADIAKKYAEEWALWESTLLSIAYDPKQLEKDIQSDPATLAIALLETHYFMNQCFIPDNFILDNIELIKHIPCHVVQGRFDMCTPAVGAYQLAQAYGDKVSLQWVNSGHLRTDPGMIEALQQAAGKLK